MYSIDQGGAAHTRQRHLAKRFDHKNDASPRSGAAMRESSVADGNTITGTWTQGPPLPLNLTRATPETAWTIPEPPPPPKLMAADANPSFEVATIKPEQTGGTLFTSGEQKRHAEHHQHLLERPDQVRLRCSSPADHRRTLVARNRRSSM